MKWGKIVMNEKLEKPQLLSKMLTLVNNLVINLLFVVTLEFVSIICVDEFLSHRSALPSSSGAGVSTLSEPLIDVILPKMCNKMTHPM